VTVVEFRPRHFASRLARLGLTPDLAAPAVLHRDDHLVRVDLSHPALVPQSPPPSEQSERFAELWRTIHRPGLTDAALNAAVRRLVYGFAADHPRVLQLDQDTQGDPPTVDDAEGWFVRQRNRIAGRKGTRPYSSEQTRNAYLFDRTYVLNLDRRPDKVAGFYARLYNDWPHQRPRRFAAVDGQHDRPPHWFTAGGGAWGCRQSHIAMLRQALTDGCDSVLIFEDDALFPSGYGGQFAAFVRNVPDDWDVLWLGNQQLDDVITVADGVVRSLKPHRTHAYGVRGRDIMRRLADYYERADNHIDHAAGRWLGSAVKTYAPKDAMVGQAGGPSDVSGGNEGNRFWGGGTEAAVRTFAGENRVRTYA
jgi:hypothetical protein